MKGLVVDDKSRARVRPLVAFVIAVALIVLGGGGSASAGSQAANGRLAFVSDGGCRFAPSTRNDEVFTMAPDGTGKTNVSRNAGADAGPAWSPDGTRIAFGRGVGVNDDIFVMSAAGKAQRNLTKTRQDEAEPDWSPDGARIAYDVGGMQIFVANADGSARQRLIPGGFTPAWSPDGQKIAFALTVEPANHEIFVANADGSGLTNLTNNPGYDDTTPAWSSDGTKIAFTRTLGTAGDIFVMNADGSGQTNLTNDPANDGEPTWSPDGTKIAFSTNRGAAGDSEIFVLNADGSNPVNLTRSPANDTAPDWQAAPATPVAPPSSERVCRVPRVIGLRVGAARLRIRTAGCAVGRVSYARSRRPRGRVTRQTLRPGVRLCFGVKVGVVVSRGLR